MRNNTCNKPAYKALAQAARTFACGPSTGILTMMKPSLPEVTVREATSV